MPKTYTLHVSLPGTGRTWRKIEMRADQTLEALHFAIQEVFDWDGDHLYSFFMSGKAWDNATEYCLPEGHDPWGMPYEDDEDEEEPELTPAEREAALRRLFGNEMPLAEMEAHMAAFWDEVEAEAAEEADRNVQTVTLENVRLDVGQMFMYLFDYGDEWRFKVRVHAVNPDAPEGEYPRLVESVGKAPSQYPDWE